MFINLLFVMMAFGGNVDADMQKAILASLNSERNEEREIEEAIALSQAMTKNTGEKSKRERKSTPKPSKSQFIGIAIRLRILELSGDPEESKLRKEYNKFFNLLFPCLSKDTPEGQASRKLYQEIFGFEYRLSDEKQCFICFEDEGRCSSYKCPNESCCARLCVKCHQRKASTEMTYEVTSHYGPHHSINETFEQEFKCACGLKETKDLDNDTKITEMIYMVSKQRGRPVQILLPKSVMENERKVVLDVACQVREKVGCQNISTIEIIKMLFYYRWNIKILLSCTERLSDI